LKFGGSVAGIDNPYDETQFGAPTPLLLRHEGVIHHFCARRIMGESMVRDSMGYLKIKHVPSVCITLVPSCALKRHLRRKSRLYDILGPLFLVWKKKEKEKQKQAYDIILLSVTAYVPFANFRIHKPLFMKDFIYRVT
jgi:hypothetical protein